MVCRQCSDRVSARGLARGLSVSNCGGPPHTPPFLSGSCPRQRLWSGRVTGAPPRNHCREAHEGAHAGGGKAKRFARRELGKRLRGAWSSAASTTARLPTGLPSRTRPCRSAGRSTQLGLAECGCKPGSHQTGYTNGGWRSLLRRRASARQHATGTPGHAHRPLRQHGNAIGRPPSRGRLPMNPSRTAGIAAG